ncbi:MAG: hypothetical protein INH41_07655 [Myxococcaceae bacterium]|nr:hypothetical protein [Myxococcaceae bacterium]
MLPVHTWFVQVPLDTAQFEQNSPVLPHLSVVVPVSQRPVARSTQPLHCWQAPDTHVCRLGQATQAAPPVPHRAVVAGFWQVPMAVQQPLGQFCALQVAAPPPVLPPAAPPAVPPAVAPPAEPPPAVPPPVAPAATHRPPLWAPASPAPLAGVQTCVPMQGAHVAPFAPHWAFDSPVKHCAFSSQHPVQVSALHRTGGGRVPHAGVSPTTPPTSAPRTSAFAIDPDCFMCGVSLSRNASPASTRAASRRPWVYTPSVTPTSPRP